MIRAGLVRRLTAAFAACTVSVGALAAPRTFVAGSGSDANACTLAQPCRSFTRALAQTDDGGEIVALESAGYGPVAISQSVTITTPAGIYAGIAVGAGQDGVDVNGSGIAVTLRGLAIRGAAGSNDGIHFAAGAQLRVERCVVENMGGTGISDAAAGGRLSVADTVIRGNSEGVLVSNTDVATFERATVENNAGDGLFLRADAVSTPGLRALVADSVVAGNGIQGVLAYQYLANTHVSVTVARTRFAGNGQQDVHASGSGGSGLLHLGVSGSTFAGVGTGVFVESLYGTHVYATISDNEILDHRATGILVSGSGAEALATRNTIGPGSIGMSGLGGGVVHSTGDNAIGDDTTPVYGTVSGAGKY
jgi:hypothetical protein